MKQRRAEALSIYNHLNVPRILIILQRFWSLPSCDSIKIVLAFTPLRSLRSLVKGNLLSFRVAGAD